VTFGNWTFVTGRYVTGRLVGVPSLLVIEFDPGRGGGNVIFLFSGCFSIESGKGREAAMGRKWFNLK
jgi:hypothetical protein